MSASSASVTDTNLSQDQSGATAKKAKKKRKVSMAELGFPSSNFSFSSKGLIRGLSSLHDQQLKKGEPKCTPWAIILRYHNARMSNSFISIAVVKVLFTFDKCKFNIYSGNAVYLLYTE